MADDRTTPSDTAPRPAQLAKLYAQPIPIKTYPLPSFYPSNPVSWVYVAYTWLNHVLSPPPAEPAVVHKGVWDPVTRSVNVHDLESMQTLWRQGFFGKGSLSRSEATWLQREKTRRGLIQDDAAEFLTAQRREERESAKWERSRSEQEVIDRQRQEEADRQIRFHGNNRDLAANCAVALAHEQLSNGDIEKHYHKTVTLPPIGPLELLALPNSVAELPKVPSMNGGSTTSTLVGSPPSSDDASDHTISLQDLTNGDDTVDGPNTSNIEGERASNPTGANGHVHPVPLKRRKSVRFSPTVESTTFQHSDPPSPNHSASSLAKIEPAEESHPTNGRANGSVFPKVAESNYEVPSGVEALGGSEVDIPNKEHLQLVPVEAFWLVYAIGALSVVDSETDKSYKTEELFVLFRQYSYFPPRAPGDVLAPLLPDDPFILDLVCYCHLRAIGWVPRPGMKFGVDWLAYKRGVVFEHAEFGMIIIPTYKDSWWQQNPPQAARRTWSWLHGVNRVLSHVFKSLILVYIDVPPPHVIDAHGNSITNILQQYSVREVMVKRWSPNRNRG